MTRLDTGGYYFDREEGVVAVARRNVVQAAEQVRSGDAGATAVGFALGAVLVPIGARLWNEVTD